MTSTYRWSVRRLLLWQENNSETAKFLRGDRADVVWAAWTAWSECSLTCGQGVRSRYRDCVSSGHKEQRGLDVQTLDHQQCDGRASDFVVCTENVTI